MRRQFLVGGEMEVKGYYINLESAAPRRRHMEAQIERLSLPIERLAAVDAGQITPDIYRQIHQNPELHALSLAELACFQSHRECWKRIAANDAPYGAVFEDDILFSEDAAKFLTDDDWIDAHNHLIKLESTSRFIIVERNRPTVKGRNLVRLYSRHLGAGGYIISRTLSKFLLNQTKVITVPVDYALFDQTYSQTGSFAKFQLHPAICIQQVRTKISFLPADADRSQLDKARASLKKRGLAKIVREVERSFRGGFYLLMMFGKSLLTRRRVILSKFKE